MTQLYFVRHGKTEWNLAGKFQGGHGDSPLLTKSYLEIAALAEKLEKVSFNHAYVSDQKRAVDTANALLRDMGQSAVPTTYTKALREFYLGDLEGMHHQEVSQKFPNEHHAMRFAPNKYAPTAFHGETFPAMILRGTQLVKEAVKENPNSNLLFVSHGQLLTATIQTLLGRSLSEIREMGGLHNSSITILTTTDNKDYQLEIWNDTTHIEEDG